MAKKAGTQIIDALKALPVNEIDNTCTITVEQRDAWIKLLKRVDKRDMQNRVERASAAKKGARKR